MAHCKKFSKASCGHMFKHYERAKDENGEYLKFGNEDIDPDRTHLNYNLAPNRGMTQGEFVRQRCEEVYCLNRKDVNVMCSWVVTMPKDLDQAKTKEFMQHTYDFLSNRYGEDNVVSAYVHMDEITPHLHFAFVPVTYDRKKSRYKVSACEVINRAELKIFHKDLESYLEQKLGCKVNILNEATKDGNKSIEELKKGSAVKKLARMEKRLEELDVVGSQMTENGSKTLSLENCTIKDRKGLFGHSERSGVFIEGVGKEAVAAIMDRADIYSSLDEKLRAAQRDADAIRDSATADHNQSIAQAEHIISQKNQLIEQGKTECVKWERTGLLLFNDAKEKIEKLENDAKEKIKKLEEEISLLTIEKSQFTREVEEILEKRDELEPLREEIDELQQVYDILTKKVKYEYTQSSFVDVASDYDYYKKYHTLVVLYEDGTQKIIGENESISYKTLVDQNEGRCRIGIFRDERTCDVPESLLMELIQNIDKEKPISKNLFNFIKQEMHVQAYKKSPSRRI